MSREWSYTLSHYEITTTVNTEHQITFVSNDETCNELFEKCIELRFVHHKDGTLGLYLDLLVTKDDGDMLCSKLGIRGKDVLAMIDNFGKFHGSSDIVLVDKSDINGSNWGFSFLYPAFKMASGRGCVGESFYGAYGYMPKMGVPSRVENRAKSERAFEIEKMAMCNFMNSTYREVMDYWFRELLPKKIIELAARIASRGDDVPRFMTNKMAIYERFTESHLTEELLDKKMYELIAANVELSSDEKRVINNVTDFYKRTRVKYLD